MNKLLALLVITFSISCSGQDKPEKKAEIVTLEHSTLDTAASFIRKDYTLYTYIPDNFPRSGGTEFWLIPKDTTDEYALEASNSMVITAMKGIMICVVPTEEKFKLSIYKNDALAEEIDFNVIDFEKPQISLYSNQELIKNNSVNLKMDSVWIKLEQPNLKYRRIYPKDCRYFSDSLIISVVRDGKTIKTFTTKDDRISLTNFDLHKNDKLHIQAINTIRKNFLNRPTSIAEKIEKEYLITE